MPGGELDGAYAARQVRSSLSPRLGCLFTPHRRVIGNVTARELRPGDKLIDDHAPSEFPKLLRLLKDGEEYVELPQPAPGIVFNGGTTRACKICARFMAVMLRSEYFNSPALFAHHVRRKCVQFVL